MKRSNEKMLAAAVFAVALLVGSKVLAADGPPAPPFPIATVPTATAQASTTTTTTPTSTAKTTAAKATSGPVETGAILLLGAVAFVSLKRYFQAKQCEL
jgi:hypothetical protein